MIVDLVQFDIDLAKEIVSGKREGDFVIGGTNWPVHISSFDPIIGRYTTDDGRIVDFKCFSDSGSIPFHNLGLNYSYFKIINYPYFKIIIRLPREEKQNNQSKEETATETLFSKEIVW